MKNLILCFLFSFVSFSQEGYVLYENEAELDQYFQDIKSSDSTRWERVKDFGNLKLKMDRSITYKLRFNNEKSIFNPILNENDGHLLKLSKSKSGAYYKDEQENFFYVNKRFRNFNVKLADIIWEITEEEKEILGYTCIKAIGNKVFENSKISSSVIVAWFTKDIQVSHGPKGINGLPGLILEAHYGSSHFYANNINLEPQKPISKPVKGEEINEEEFSQLMRSAVKN
jgi:GLPGLI family protein